MTEDKTRAAKSTIQLVCVFTDAERREIAEEMAAAVVEQQQAEEAQKEASARSKAVIAGAFKRVADAARKLTTGHEQRPVLCETTFNYTAGTVEVVRLDNFQTVSLRAMTAEEAQLFLDGIEKEARAAEASPAADGAR